ncbi:hypothetical protein ACFQU2_26080 [Siccirubricoccus deserti]
MNTLIADIGGTNARFALHDGTTYTPPVKLALDGFTNIAAAIAAYLGDRPPPRPRCWPSPARCRTTRCG